MTVWIYVDTRKQVGDRDHLKVFANEDAAETWFQENDPEGVAFEYEVLESTTPASRPCRTVPELTHSPRVKLNERVSL
jgi:hypothetical protein